MLINWFSPLPPSSTDISQYTRRILPDLSKKADIRLWTENKEYDPYLADWAEVIVYDKNKRWELLIFTILVITLIFTEKFGRYVLVLQEL